MRRLSRLTSGAEPAIARMNSSCQVLVIENDLEQIRQLRLLLSGKTGHEGLMVFSGRLSDSSKCALAIGGQVKRIEAAIVL